jgi:hypothetical protein
LGGLSLSQGLKLTIGASDEFLDDRGRQNSLALADLGDVVAPSRRI